MRTVKASEVVKGMRVEVTYTDGEVQIVTRGPVVKVEAPNTGGRVWLYLGDDYQEKVHPDHPVTVLAEPEPEWVEGAWYWASARGATRLVRRVQGGWSGQASGYARVWLDDSDHPTILGRVLIVDWPGDGVARAIERHGTSAPIRFVSAFLDKVAAAIRTQGGAR